MSLGVGIVGLVTIGPGLHSDHGALPWPTPDCEDRAELSRAASHRIQSVVPGTGGRRVETVAVVANLERDKGPSCVDAYERSASAGVLDHVRKCLSGDRKEFRWCRATPRLRFQRWAVQ